jgi:tetratricopeptide (TPR) repeat protein
MSILSFTTFVSSTEIQSPAKQLLSKIETLLFFPRMKSCLRRFGLQLLLALALCSCKRQPATNTFDYFYNSGVYQSESGNYKEAVNFFDKAIQLDPTNAEAYINRGIAKSLLRDYAGAVDDDTKAIAVEPDSAYNHYIRGNAEFNLQKYPDVIADDTKAIELNSGYALAYFIRGAAKLQQANYADAIMDEEKALELDPANANAWLNIGSAQTGLKDLPRRFRLIIKPLN